MFQDIGHGFILFFPISVHALRFSFYKVFGLKTCFIFHLFLCILSSVIIYTLNKAATFRMTILYKKRDLN